MKTHHFLGAKYVVPGTNYDHFFAICNEEMEDAFNWRCDEDMFSIDIIMRYDVTVSSQSRMALSHSELTSMV